MGVMPLPILRKFLFYLRPQESHLYQAAQVASVKNRYFKAYFTGLLQGRQRERGIHTKIRVKLAAKMLVIAWAVMKRKEAFDPGRLNIG